MAGYCGLKKTKKDLKMKMPRIVLISALVSCALLSGCKDDKASAVTIEFMHSSVEQERQAVITKLIEKFEKENPASR
jgi:multiple sugar transport system substrate-binding protein